MFLQSQILKSTLKYDNRTDNGNVLNNFRMNTHSLIDMQYNKGHALSTTKPFMKKKRFFFLFMLKNHYLKSIIITIVLIMHTQYIDISGYAKLCFKEMR